MSMYMIDSGIKGQKWAIRRNQEKKTELYHFGIKGQKWGVRRYQNDDGTLTAAGKKRYSDYENGVKASSETKKAYKRIEKLKKTRSSSYEKSNNAGEN